MSLLGAVHAHALATPDRPTLLGDDVEISYGELWRRVDGAAAALAERPGVVGVPAVHCPDTVVSLLAFERLGLVAGDFCLHVAAVVAGTTEHRVRHLLDELLGVHLVVEGGSGGFGFHDVVGRFARRLASAQEWTLVLPPGCPECLLSRPAAPAAVAARRVPVPA